MRGCKWQMSSWVPTQASNKRRDPMTGGRVVVTHKCQSEAHEWLIFYLMLRHKIPLIIKQHDMSETTQWIVLQTPSTAACARHGPSAKTQSGVHLGFVLSWQLPECHFLLRLCLNGWGKRLMNRCMDG